MKNTNINIRMILLYILVPILIILSAFYPNDKTIKETDAAFINKEQSSNLPENKEQGKVETKKANEDKSGNYDQIDDKDKGIDLFGTVSNNSVLPNSAKDSIPSPIKSKPLRSNNIKQKVYYEPMERPNGYYENSTTHAKQNEEQKIEELRKQIAELKSQNTAIEKTEKNELVEIPSMIQTSITQKTDRFFSVENKNLSTNSSSLDLNKKNIVALAEIMETKRVRDNTSIKIKILENIKFGNTSIQAGSYLTGICNFTGNGDRLMISLNSMVVNSTFLAVSGTVLDMDGTVGVQIYGMQEQKSKNTVLSRVAQGTTSSTAPLYFMGSQAGSVGQQIVGQVVGGVASQTLNAGQALLAQNMSKLYADINAGHRVYINISTK